MAREEYALIDAERLRERRKSSPDSDPVELKKQLLDHRFDAVHNRVDGVHNRVDGIEKKLDMLAEKQADSASKQEATTLAVAKSDASFRAYGSALALFLTLITIAASVLPRLMK